MDGLVLPPTLVVRRASEKKMQGVKKRGGISASYHPQRETIVLESRDARQAALSANVCSVILGWSRGSMRHLCRAYFAASLLGLQGITGQD